MIPYGFRLSYQKEIIGFHVENGRHEQMYEVDVP
jgi:hypothetical protein